MTRAPVHTPFHADGLIVAASEIPERRSRWAAELSGQYEVRPAGSLNALRRALRTYRPSLLLLDLALPRLNEASGITALHLLSPATKILVITHAVDDRAVVALLRAGASGCCFYDTDAATLKKATDFVAKGQMWVSRTVIAFLLDQLTSAAEAPEGGALSVATDPRFAELTPRQREIAALVGTAASNREIAVRLHVTEKTVKAHLTAVFRTLGVTDRLQLALLVSRRA